MIITRTPFRMSFFGGGTDYPSWFESNPGATLSATINKYCYISIRELPPFFNHNHRVVYSKIENVNFLDEIEHPSVRETLKYFLLDKNLEIHHDGDLPARSGLGSSSSFTVGLVNALCCLKKKNISKKILAEISINIEQNIIKENVGSQDQIAASFGGINFTKYTKDNFTVKKIKLSEEREKLLNDSILLFYTGISRNASHIAKEQVNNTLKNRNYLKTLYDLTLEGKKLIESSSDLVKDFGYLINESWALKKKLSSKISNNIIDNIYNEALSSGAYGGKLLGAGAGGFMIIISEKKYQKMIKNKLKKFLHVPFCFEKKGSTIIFNSK